VGVDAARTDIACIRVELQELHVVAGQARIGSVITYALARHSADEEAVASAVADHGGEAPRLRNGKSSKNSHDQHGCHPRVSIPH